jgi:RimJ/RimL family protein N-acetyltransferase
MMPKQQSAHAFTMGLPAAKIRRLYQRATARVRRWATARNLHARKRLIFVFDFAETLVEPPDPRFAFRELEPEEIDEQHTTRSADIPRVLVAGAESGCVLGTLDGVPVYHAWYIRADARALHGLPNGWRPRGRVLFLHDGYTEPPFRGKGIHSAATRWLLSRESTLNTAHAVCLVHADNPFARRAVAKAGFRVVGRSD